MYVFQLFDYYGASGMCLLWMCFFEATVVAWIYGADRFDLNIREMLRKPIVPYFRMAWKYLTPFVTMGILISTLVTHKPIMYNNTYSYPTWGIALGWFLALSSMSAVPTYVIYSFCVTEGSLRERWVKLTTSKPSPYVVDQERKKQQQQLLQNSAGVLSPFPDIVLDK